MPGLPGIGAGHLFALLFGTIVGVGWIAATGSWVAHAGPAGAIIAFGFGAAIMTLIGLCYAELMAMLPDSSGSVGYAQLAFGTGTAFMIGWLLLLCYCATIAFFIVTIPWLLEVLIPNLMGPKLYRILGFDVRLGPAAFTLTIALWLGWVNHRGIAAMHTQVVIVSGKIVIAAVLGAAALANGHVQYLPPLLGHSAPDAVSTGIAAVLISTPFWFGGFDVLPQAIRERRATLKLARLGWLIIGTTLAAFCFYAMIILATSSLLPRGPLLARSLPAFAAFKEGLKSQALADAVIVLGLIGVCSGWNANLFSASRILRVLGQAGLVPPVLGVSHGRHGTPARAAWSITSVALGLGLLGPGAVEPIVAAASIALVSTFVILCAGLVRLRTSHPNIPRPYRVPSMWLPRLAIALSVALLLLSVLEPYMSEGQTHLPIAWIIVGLWSVSGGILWAINSDIGNANAAARRAALLKAIP